MKNKFTKRHPMDAAFRKSVRSTKLNVNKGSIKPPSTAKQATVQGMMDAFKTGC